MTADPTSRELLLDLLDQTLARSGLTGKELAARAHLAPETLSRLRTRGTADFETLAKLVRSAGLRLQVQPTGPGDNPHERLDARSLALHALVVGKVLADPSLIERKVLPTIARFRETHRGSGTEPLLKVWEAAAQGGATRLAQVCLEVGSRGQQLRQSSPMTGILSPDERRRVYESFSA